MAICLTGSPMITRQIQGRQQAKSVAMVAIQQVKNKAGNHYSSSAAQERADALKLSLSGLLGPWRGWAEAPDEAGWGYRGCLSFLGQDKGCHLFRYDDLTVSEL